MLIRTFSDSTPIDASILGPKGAALAELASLGLPVAPGFTLTTNACDLVREDGWTPAAEAALSEALSKLEDESGRRLGASERPLLLVLRAGSTVPRTKAQSVPEVAETVMPIGLSRERAVGLGVSGLRAFRRFLYAYGSAVCGLHSSRLQRSEATVLEGVPDDDSAEGLTVRCDALLEAFASLGHEVPTEPTEQLRNAIDAVYAALDSHRVRYYRKRNGIAEDAGVAVHVMHWVDTVNGVVGTVSTRHPSTGAPELYGAWARGVTLPALTRGDTETLPLDALAEAEPEAHKVLVDARAKLEAHYKDSRDLDFAVPDGGLVLLHSRRSTRTALALVRTVIDLVAAGLISRSDALRRVRAADLEDVLRPVIRSDAKRRVIAKGLDASPGAATGRVVFDSSEVSGDDPAILVRMETTPSDIQGLSLAAGVLTSRGGQTSHAAVLARGMGKPCVVGCSEITVDYARGLFYAGDSVIQKGDWITIDGTTGEVMEGRVEMVEAPTSTGPLSELLEWADDVATLKVRANAESAADAVRARDLGAVGIGLCRTEHLFFETEALQALRRVILADEPLARQRALQALLPVQRAIFREMFTAMDGHPVTIRLLDPPVHEFLPDAEGEIAALAQLLGVRKEVLIAKVGQLEESNPMLGHRGVRLAVSWPEVVRSQVRAVMEAACEATKAGIVCHPELLVPLVSIESEVANLQSLITDVANDVRDEYGVGPELAVGTMIEVPRAALIADQLALHVSFFSLGTNDLTQLTYGMSRDDAGRFLAEYQRRGLLESSPFVELDTEGVGKLLRLAVDGGRATKPELEVGCCGEHAGQPEAIRFFHEIGLDYVSCSPFRVPVARLAAAHAALG